MFKKSLCAELHEAFCRGESINVAEFAADHRVSRGAINLALKYFGELIESRHGVRDSQRHVRWHCVDQERMLRFIPPTWSAQRRKTTKAEEQETARTDVFAPLLSAWGLPTRPVALHLPKTVHIMVDDHACA